MDARRMVAVMSCVLGASAFADEAPRTGKALLATMKPMCPRLVAETLSQYMAKDGPRLTPAQVKSVCGCVDAELTRTLEPERTYTPAEFEPLFEASARRCLAPEFRKAFVPAFLAHPQLREVARKKGVVTDTQYAAFCECAADAAVAGMDQDLSTQASRATAHAKLTAMREACFEKARAESAP